MKRILLAAVLLIYLLPVEAGAKEIIIAANSAAFIPDGFRTMVTAGTVGVVASAGLLILSNRR